MSGGGPAPLSQRLDPPEIADKERQLRQWLRDFSKRRPRWGWRRTAMASRRADWKVNDKRIRRLLGDDGLRVPLRGLGLAVGAMSPIRPDALWAMDFQFDVTADGRTLKLLNVVDELTRRGPRLRCQSQHRHRRCRGRTRPPRDSALRAARVRALRSRSEFIANAIAVAIGALLTRNHPSCGVLLLPRVPASRS